MNDDSTPSVLHRKSDVAYLLYAGFLARAGSFKRM